MEARSKNERSLSSDCTLTEKQWKSIWYINAPNKMKVFFCGILLVIVYHLEFSCNKSASLPHRFFISLKDWEALSILLFSVLMPGEFGTRLNEPSASILVGLISPLQGNGSSAFSLGNANSMQLLWLCQSGIYGMRETIRGRNICGAPYPRRLALKINTYVDLIARHLHVLVLVHRRETLPSNFDWSSPLPGSVSFLSDAAIFADLGRCNSFESGVPVHGYLQRVYP